MCVRTSALQLTPFASVASLFGVIYEFIICRTSQTREREAERRKAAGGAHPISMLNVCVQSS